jgi:integrase/recombinase XerD
VCSRKWSALPGAGHSLKLKDLRDKAIFCVLLYSWCRVSALTNLNVADYYERAGTRWLRFQEKRGKDHEIPVHSKALTALKGYFYINLGGTQ